MPGSLDIAAAPDAKVALDFPEGRLTYAGLRGVSGALAAQLPRGGRVAVWAEPKLQTGVALVAALRAGAAVIPVNPKLGVRELRHVVEDSAPDVVVRAPGVDLPPPLDTMPAVDVPESGEDPGATGEMADDLPALIMYTSGTTGPPKGVVLSRGAVASNMSALADAWEWTSEDVLVHALPLFHAHGLVLGILGPLLVGATVRHAGRFDPAAIATALEDGGTMLFAVPTMYHRLGAACEDDERVARALGRARILVSGSAPLPVREHERIERLTGQRIVERYGLTETLMVCVVRASGDRRPGYVGPPLTGVEVRLLGDDGEPVPADDATMGEVAVRGPNVFDGYLGQPEATAAVVRDGWFHTGDLATMAPDGYVRIFGRRSTDLIKTGGYRVGAGEVEAALVEHPAVAEAAVVGRPDDDLGQRIAAWVVLHDGAGASEDELIDHVRTLLSSHKRPREVHLTDALPRNALGKIQKSMLGG